MTKNKEGIQNSPIEEQALDALSLLPESDKLKVLGYIQSLERLQSLDSPEEEQAYE